MAILESSVSIFNPARNLASFRFHLNPLQALFTAISLHYLRPDLPLLISDLPLHGTSKLLLLILPSPFSPTDLSASSPPLDFADSSPRSREIESDNGSNHHPASCAASEDVPPVAAASAAVAGRVKLMISYSGRIQPRPHDNQLSYLNGETKILSVDPSMRFPDFHSKLAAITGSDEVCIKYQLPEFDLDALISVTNDEDLEHMILEFDRLHLHLSSNSF